MASQVIDISGYEYLWTTERKDYALFTVTCYGNKEFLIYHRPTKQVSIIRGDIVGQMIIKKMIEMGVPVIDDPPCKPATGLLR